MGNGSGSPSEAGVLLSWPRPDIAAIALNRPQRRNALTPDLIRELLAALREAGSTEACRVVVLTGTGRGFCAGMDITAGVERDTGGPRGPAVRIDNQELFASTVRTIRGLRQPVIAAVNGAAAGAGLGLALACDMRIAAPTASFHVAAVKIGLSAGECGISYHLPRHIGSARAFEVMLTGRPIAADEAERIGLVSRVVPEADLLDEALTVAGQITENSPYAVWQSKMIMWTNLDNDFNSAIELENHTQILATMTEDAGEAMRAFVEKRPPVFRGR
jgi:enoyl-CoA hydratase